MILLHFCRRNPHTNHPENLNNCFLFKASPSQNNIPKIPPHIFRKLPVDRQNNCRTKLVEEITLRGGGFQGLNSVDHTCRCKKTFLRFLANVNSRSRSLYAIARPSVVCLSVCLSVTLVHPTQAVQIFGNISTALGTLAIR